MSKKKDKELEITEDMLLKELKYLVDEGFIKYNPIDETYSLKSDHEIKEDVENV